MTEDRYKDKTYIGSGGMASVYKAYDSVLERYVAIKEMAERLRDNESIRRLFLNEARKMASVRHQNVVQVYDVIDDQALPTIVMEFMDGGSLASKLGTGTLPTDAVMNVLEQVNAGLRAIHSVGVVHRDIKPDNIISDKGIYKITDFGVAMSGSDTTLPFVTNKYAAPEVLLAPEKIGSVSDLYSLGMMAIELLLGARRFEKEVRELIEDEHTIELPAIRNSEQALWQQWVASSVEFPPLHTLEPSIAPQLSQLLLDLTKREQSERIQDCETLSDRLAEVRFAESQRVNQPTAVDSRLVRKRQKAMKARERDGAAAVTDEQAPAKKAKKKSPLWFKLLAGTGGLLIAAFVALLLWPTPAPPIYLEVATEPPGAAVTINGEVVPEIVTPTAVYLRWGNTLGFELADRDAFSVELAEGMPGLNPTETGFRLDTVALRERFIDSSAAAASLLQQRLPNARSVEVTLLGGAPADEGFVMEVGRPLEFEVVADRPGELAMIHLGADDYLTLIYPSPRGETLAVDVAAPVRVGPEINLATAYPLGSEWFVFLVGDSLDLEPAVEVFEQVGDWGRAYGFGPERAPGHDFVVWLLEAVDGTDIATRVIPVEIVDPEAGP